MGHTDFVRLIAILTVITFSLIRYYFTEKDALPITHYRLPTSLTIVFKKFLLILIRGYRAFISPLFPPSCRFHPTCSQYALQAIDRFGLWQGGWMSLRRILRCHPLHPGGYDPVPSNLEKDDEDAKR